MRWMLLKDLQILWRSKLLLSLLIAYPIAIALLIGFALSSGPDKPRVAFLNQTPPDERTILLGGQRIQVKAYTDELLRAVDEVPVQSREDALAKIRSGEALAAIIIPADFTKKLSNSGFSSARVEVIYNGDALKQSFVRTTISAKLAQADAALARQVNTVAAGYVDRVVNGGELTALGASFNLLGLRESKRHIDNVLRRAAPKKYTARELKPVQTFASFAVANVGRITDVLDTIERPVQVDNTVLNGRRTPLDAFAIAIAVSVSLMFVCVLLASGLLALEREENTFARLARGLVPGGRLLAGKIVLAAACAFAVTLVMLLGISAFVPLDYGRAALWVVAIAGGAIAFAALGVAIGSLAREVRAASLLAFLLSLPLAFLALVPSGGVSPELFEVIQVISAAFPFKPALNAINAAINNSSPGVGPSILHLAALTAVFGLAARAGLRRFA